jgi:hypothetical protein
LLAEWNQGLSEDRDAKRNGYSDAVRNWRLMRIATGEERVFNVLQCEAQKPPLNEVLATRRIVVESDNGE